MRGRARPFWPLVALGIVAGGAALALAATPDAGVRPGFGMRLEAPVAPKEIARRIRLRLGDVQRCYEDALRRRPSLAGKLTVGFTVIDDGDVRDVSFTDNTLRAPEVETCIRRRLLAWTFPPPEGGAVQFNFPFIFQPSTPDRSK